MQAIVMNAFEELNHQSPILVFEGQQDHFRSAHSNPWKD